jgi:hypothetical protein
MKMREKRKDGMLSYGFLLDRDVSKAASLFPKKRTKTIADIGLPHEVFGLIVLPNGYERQRRILQNIERTLRLGKEAIAWTDVAYRNCYVRVKRNGGTEVKRFPRCFYCQKNEMKYKT